MESLLVFALVALVSASYGVWFEFATRDGHIWAWYARLLERVKTTAVKKVLGGCIFCHLFYVNAAVITACIGLRWLTLDAVSVLAVFPVYFVSCALFAFFRTFLPSE